MMLECHIPSYQELRPLFTDQNLAYVRIFMIGYHAIFVARYSILFLSARIFNSELLSMISQVKRVQEDLYLIQTLAERSSGISEDEWAEFLECVANQRPKIETALTYLESLTNGSFFNRQIVSLHPLKSQNFILFSFVSSCGGYICNLILILMREDKVPSQDLYVLQAIVTGAVIGVYIRDVRDAVERNIGYGMWMGVVALLLSAIFYLANKTKESEERKCWARIMDGRQRSSLFEQPFDLRKT
ncbi:hypothetical protein G7Y89_g13585 [Cudoniella acicularis]|uniref:Uncharacterized protein n=1 Tax=Cudoniella acicularis TaxID=354080 RepID=A0A8H4R896_9HELO|nr:hypothetical protein G7Y89_g13585 [Cudoniella acicularis]